tara:strand:+ start:643 stop:1734 length:1092 start_codon:yes stop_codon:yes gene_type:complete
MVKSKISQDTYALKSSSSKVIKAPDFNYKPPITKSYNPYIAIVGTGGITSTHLAAYKKAKYKIEILYNRTLSKAKKLRDIYFPKAKITNNFNDILNNKKIEILDITLHPEEREEFIKKGILAGKHILSQKPFVNNLKVGKKLVKLAKKNNVKIAINQNGRWAPHFAYIREAVKSNLIGDVISCHTSIQWNHSWIKNTEFENNYDLILYDFGIHWFDFLTSILGNRIINVFASQNKAITQTVKPPLLSQCLVQLNQGQASLIFDGFTNFGTQDRTIITGTKGTIISVGPDLGKQKIEIYTKKGKSSPKLKGSWFNDGFHGTMGELLSSIEEKRNPLNNAEDNLLSLKLTFAALESSKLNKIIKF